jgi:hypothetical protein
VQPLFPDTSPEAERVLVELHRLAPAWRKLQMVGQLNELVRNLVVSGLRQRHPHADDDEIQRRYAQLVLGDELAAKVIDRRRTTAAGGPFDGA